MVDYRILIDIRSGLSSTPLIKEDDLEGQYIDGCRNGGLGKSLALYFSGLKNPRSLGSTPPPGPPDSEFLVQVSVPMEKDELLAHHAKIPLGVVQN